ncbi:hypothetical protein [Streptomyces griseosporeus]
MSAALLAGLSVPAVYLLAAGGVWLTLWWERRRPSSYTRSREYREAMAEWRSLSTAEQAARDAAEIEAVVAVEAAEADAQEAARLAVERAAEVNALFRP